VTEYELKAAVLAVLGRYIDWPPASQAQRPSAPFMICVLGRDVFEGSLEEAVAEKTLRDRKVAVRYTRSAATASACHIVFVSSSESSHAAEVLRVLRASNALIVADTPVIADAGAYIYLRMDERQVRFQIDAAALRNRGFGISSQLLKMAEVVRRGTP
jgi:hypothetical protein